MADVWVGRHEIIDAIVENLTAWWGEPVDRNPYGFKDRTGWFGASSLKSKTHKDIKYSPRKMLLEFFGKLPPMPINNAIAFGSYFDMVTEAAMRARPDLFVSTQAQFFNEDLRFRGTPDFVFDDAGFDIPGDVKALHHFGWKYPADPEYDISKAYYYRQFQAVMWASGADYFYEVGFCRYDDTPFDLTIIPDIGRLMFVRRVERDEKAIAEIVKDLEFVNSRIPDLQAALDAGDDEAFERALPVEI